ncbi:MAG: hypothetical protein MJ180_04040 [Candidatus Gastranaerophilales bacterium]|nr:hypothetical protein [Candidatus Gastranaerophilales bacterium]
MNLNEKCLLKYLTNPISISNAINDEVGNVIKNKNFAYSVLDKIKNKTAMSK